MIHIERYQGTEANVNSHLLSDGQNLIVVDLLRNSLEAEALANHVVKSGLKLHTIFVTHGHPDHYIGLGIFHRRFPEVPIKVATQAIKDDIIHFSGWMESIGWLEPEPHMKVQSDKNPDGFDYANIIQVLEQPRLTLPLSDNTIEVKADYASNECGHMTTLCIPEQKVFMAADFIYNGVHAWCGPGVDDAEIHNWLRILNEFSEMDSDKNWTFYCGHGPESDVSVVENMKKYLQTFLEVVASEATPEAGIEKMKKLFPGLAQADFLLDFSMKYHIKTDDS